VALMSEIHQNRNRDMSAFATVLLLLFLFGGAASSGCAPLYSVTCENGFQATAADPGLTGNLAFPVLASARTFEMGRKLSAFVSNWNNASLGALFTPSNPDEYHVSIYYFPCVSANRTEKVHKSLRTFKWKALRVRLASTCCSNELEHEWSTLLCVDDASELLIRNFSAAIRQHLEQDLGHGSIPNKESVQPHHHLTVGGATASVDMEHIILDSRLPRPDPAIELQLDTFYFGTEVYVSDDFLQPGGDSNLVYLALVVVVVPFALCWCLIPAMRLACCVTFGCSHCLIASERWCCQQACCRPCRISQAKMNPVLLAHARAKSQL
jgi:hypothetical protein